MLSVREPPPEELLLPLHPAKLAAKQANKSKPAAAYPSRLPSRGHFRCSRAACCASVKSRIARTATTHKGIVGMRSRGCGLFNGTSWESDVVNEAVQDALPLALAAPLVPL
jgi:hypothetical protein